MLLQEQASTVLKIKNNEGCHRRVLASCPRPRRLLGARSHVDSHDLASDSESATAGQSVRRVQAPTGHSARWHQTVSEVFSTVPRSPGTLDAQCHARVTTSRPRYNDTEGDKVLRTPSLRERAVSPWPFARLCAHGACRLHAAGADMQLTGVHGNGLCCAAKLERASHFFSPGRSWGGQASGA